MPTAQVVKLDDRGVTLESDGFLARYAVSTDADQDQLAVWQLFSPGLIDWLTSEAPAGFSFELQDGALACFVPGYVTEPAALDALCTGAARVFAQVEQIDGDGRPRTPTAVARGPGARSSTASSPRTLRDATAEHQGRRQGIPQRPAAGRPRLGARRRGVLPQPRRSPRLHPDRTRAPTAPAT